MAKSNTRYQWLTALYALIGLFIYWFDIFINSHLYLFASKSKGIRDYFTTLYYALYDQNLLLNGFNYPYGKELIQTHSQIGLSVPLSYLMNGNFDYAGNVIVMLNTLMFLSIPLAAVYLFKLFSLWRMSHLFSSGFAVAIALLSPQILNFTDTHALSYVCFFPMIWYFSANWLQNKSISSLIFYLLTLTFFTFIHIAYLLITVFFIASSTVLYIIYKLKKGQYQFKIEVLLLLTFVPFALYYIGFSDSLSYFFSDSVHASDISSMTVSFRELFLPSKGIILDAVNLLYPVNELNIDNYSYVGVGAVISASLGVWVLRDRITEQEFLAPGLGVFIIGAASCLFFASGLPFKFISPSWIPEEIIVLKSFGVFTVPFYFVFSSSAVWLLYILSEYIKKRSQSFYASLIVAVVFLIWITEGMSLQKKQSRFIHDNGKLVNEFLSFENSYESMLVEIGQSPDYYQAILAFPYFESQGTGTSFNLNRESFFYAAKASLEMEIPILTSGEKEITSGKDYLQYQLLGNPMLEKEIIKDFKDERSILLITQGDRFQDFEERIIKKSRLLIQKGSITLYDLPISTFEKQYPVSLEALNRLPSKIHDDLEYKSSGFGSFLWKNFKNKSVSEDKHPIGSFIYDKKNTQVDYEVSLWYHYSNKSFKNLSFYADILDAEDKIIHRYSYEPDFITDITADLVRAKIIVPYSEQNAKIHVYFQEKTAALHTLLIKPVSQDIWIKQSDLEFFNNYPLDY